MWLDLSLRIDLHKTIAANLPYKETDGLQTQTLKGKHRTAYHTIIRNQPAEFSMDKTRVIGLGWGWMECMRCPVGYLARPSTASAWIDPTRSCMPATNLQPNIKRFSLQDFIPRASNSTSPVPLISIVFIETVAASMEGYYEA